MRMLFLDFDGVLHPIDVVTIDYADHGVTITGNGLLRHAPRLDVLLSNHPDVAVVISSSWRNNFPLDELKERLGPLGQKAIGTINSTVVPDRMPFLHEQRPIIGRYRHCEELADHFGVTDWLLIDDDPFIVWRTESGAVLPDLEQRVILCDSMLGMDTPGCWHRLDSWLRSKPE